MLEENDTLAAETTGKEDQDGTGLEALADLSGTDSLANLFLTQKSTVRKLISNWVKTIEKDKTR